MASIFKDEIERNILRCKHEEYPIEKAITNIEQHALVEIESLTHRNAQLNEYMKNIHKIIKANKDALKVLELMYETLHIILEVSKED